MIEFIEYKFGAEIPVKPGEWYLAIYNTGIIKEPTNRVSQYSWTCPYEHIVEYLIFPDSHDLKTKFTRQVYAIISNAVLLEEAWSQFYMKFPSVVIKGVRDSANSADNSAWYMKRVCNSAIYLAAAERVINNREYYEH